MNDDVHNAAETYTELLARSSINFQKVKVFVIDLNEKQLLNDDFINEVNVLKNTSEFESRFNNNLIMVPVTGSIMEKDYYLLDAHLRSSGHQKIAALLNNLIFKTDFPK